MLARTYYPTEHVQSLIAPTASETEERNEGAGGEMREIKFLGIFRHSLGIHISMLLYICDFRHS